MEGISLPFPLVELGGPVVSTLVHAIAQVNSQVLGVVERCSECSLTAEYAEYCNCECWTH